MIVVLHAIGALSNASNANLQERKNYVLTGNKFKEIIFIAAKTIRKSIVRETQNLSTFLKRSTNTKTDKNREKGEKENHMLGVMCWVSGVICPKVTNTHTHMTHGHCNLETESAKWADSVKIF